MRVLQENKDRIAQIMEEYVSMPNALVRGGFDTRHNIIGRVVAKVRNPYYAELFVACETAEK